MKAFTMEKCLKILNDLKERIDSEDPPVQKSKWNNFLASVRSGIILILIVVILGILCKG